MGDQQLQRSLELGSVDGDVHVFADVGALCNQLAAEIADQVVRGSGRFSLALTGGATSSRLYARLGQAHSGVPWSDVDFFWSDERLVPFDDPASNFRGAYEAWLQAARIPVAQMHRPNVGAEDPDAIARAYEEDIRRSLGPGVSFDCVLLSLGKDGHVASLFPGRPATLETDRLVVPEIESPKPPPRRVTMTLPLINRAKRVHLVAVGLAKASALRATVARQIDHRRWPALGVRPTAGQLSLWVDSEAAGSRLAESRA